MSLAFPTTLWGHVMIHPNFNTAPTDYKVHIQPQISALMSPVESESSLCEKSQNLVYSLSLYLEIAICPC